MYNIVGSYLYTETVVMYILYIETILISKTILIKFNNVN